MKQKYHKNDYEFIQMIKPLIYIQANNIETTRAKKTVEKSN